MEPSDYPRSDPGPYTLLTDVSTVENLDRLEWVLAQATGYVGVVTKMGGRFTADNESMMPVPRGAQNTWLDVRRRPRLVPQPGH